MSNAHGKSDMTPTESKTTGTVGNVPHGSRETPVTSDSIETDQTQGRRRHIEAARRLAALPGVPHGPVGRLDVAGEARGIEQPAGLLIRGKPGLHVC